MPTIMVPSGLVVCWCSARDSIKTLRTSQEMGLILTRMKHEVKRAFMKDYTIFLSIFQSRSIFT
jgi:hypothetical protein